jgi:hypothetical protein
MSWVATSAVYGRFPPVEVTSTQDELLAQYEELGSHSEGYIEVRNSSHEYPWVAMGFRAGHAVIHRAEGPESMSLLHGDGSVPSDATVEILIMNDLAIFTGKFVVTLEHAWRLMREVARTGEVGDSGDWRGL